MIDGNLIRKLVVEALKRSSEQEWNWGNSECTNYSWFQLEEQVFMKKERNNKVYY